MKNGKDYVLIDPRTLPVFSGTSTKQCREFMFYMFENANPYSNILIGTYKDMAEGAGVSRHLVSRRLQQLNKADLVRKAGQNMWMINPDAYFAGEDEDLDQMIQDYLNLPEYSE